ncbi:MAG TPA: signal peptidase I [Bacilli bacterium]|nr:signal peptidase I [Bacilli bacterium]
MNLRRRLHLLALGITIVIILTSFFIFSIAQVVGHSMAPTVEHNQWIITNQLSYSFNEPRRGDVILIDHDGNHYIKRIIGLPNETIEMINQQLYIDGIPYSQRFITDRSSFWTHDIPKTTIPNHSYYVLGDNRIASNDSRYSLGFIEISDIVGRAEFIIYPLSDWKVIH